MKFPGRRGHRHYFPVNDKGRTSLDRDVVSSEEIFIVGLDQLLVDIEINVTDDFLDQYRLEKGQSTIINDDAAEEIYRYCHANELIQGEYPGGAVGNTLHNFCVLSDSPCVALGAINRNIEVGDYCFKYLSKTSAQVDMGHLYPSGKAMGRALCFITPDLERTFAISKGCMNDFPASSVPRDLVAKSSAVLISAYTLRGKEDPIYQASYELAKIACENNVPVVFSLGTSSLVKEHKQELMSFIEQYVSIVAMNQQEALALTGVEDPLLALNAVLEITDVALITVGNKGLYMGGHVDDQFKRETKEQLYSKSIPEYNKFEYSRPMRRALCSNPLKFFTHINPFQGGPEVIKNTNGAGDAALAAVLHDIGANRYHRKMMPNSSKHVGEFLTYSSLSQISKYANRVSFEVLIQNSPRLFKALPAREDSLDDEYWSK